MWRHIRRSFGRRPLTHAPDRPAAGAVLQPDCQPRNRPHSIVDDTADRVRAVPGAARDSVPHWPRVVSRAPAGWTQRHTRTRGLRRLRSLGRHNRRFYEPFPWAGFQDHPKRVQPPNSGAAGLWRVLGSDRYACHATACPARECPLPIRQRRRFGSPAPLCCNGARLFRSRIGRCLALDTEILHSPSRGSG
jgi:hypothetical protein